MIKERKVTILASGTGWQECPFDQETWAIGKMIMYPVPPARVDKIFNMDNIEKMLSFDPNFPGRVPYSREDLVKKANELAVPFITCYPYPGLEHLELFPLKKIHEQFGIIYYTNTICYMIAYALLEGVTHLTFYGVNQAGSLEYMKERKGVEFWLGLAAGLGTGLEVKGGSALLHNDGVLYGYGKSEGEIVKEFNLMPQ